MLLYLDACVTVYQSINQATIHTPTCAAFRPKQTSCARGDTIICLRPLQVDNIFAVLLFVSWHLFRHAGYLRHQQQVDLLTLKVVSESRVTWATSVPILLFLGPSVLELGPMYATDRRQTSDVRQNIA